MTITQTAHILTSNLFGLELKLRSSGDGGRDGKDGFIFLREPSPSADVGTRPHSLVSRLIPTSGKYNRFRKIRRHNGVLTGRMSPGSASAQPGSLICGGHVEAIF